MPHPGHPPTHKPLVRWLPGWGGVGGTTLRKHVPAGQRGERIEINECSPNELLNDPVVGLVMMSDGVDRQILELFDPEELG